MATATEAPASSTAEGPTSHTQNQDLELLIARLERLEEQKTAASGTHGYTRAEQMEALHRLREPFPQSEVRYRPQPWCKACSGQKSWPKVCERHTEIKCQRCNGQKITEAHICLKYIGHAEATNRLLNVDPFWDWEPMALDQVGLPQYDGNRGMWIRLTVCGMTRIGYGDAQGKDGANAVKEIIGDAIRNAGMRFGMALDLWTSSDLEIIESGGAPTEEAGAPTQTAAPQDSVKKDGPSDLDNLKSKVNAGWNNVLACEQNLHEARLKNLLDEKVPVGEELVRVEDLLTKRINDLKAAPGGDTERSAA